MHVYGDSGSRLKALGLVAVLSVIFSIIAERLSNWLGIGPSWLVSPPAVAASFGIIYGFLERTAWRWKVLRSIGIIDTLPIDGRYMGNLVSSYMGTKLPIQLDVEQTWSRIIVKFEVVAPRSSSSVSLAATIARIGEDEARLTYFYRNAVRPGVADPDMGDHDGTAELLVNIASGSASGRYYNYRGRQGDLILSRSARGK